MAASWRTALIKKTRKKANSCVQDVEQVLKYFLGLRHGIQEHTYENGRQAELFVLEGTIPVQFKGVTYNIPVCVLLQEGHPEVPPLVYVRPTSSMAIKASPYVDTNGRVYHPYLHEWNYKSSNIVSLLRQLCGIFGQHPPVYSIMPKTSNTSVAQQQTLQPPDAGSPNSRPQESMSPDSATQDPTSTGNKKECIICMNNIPNSVLIPCGHLGLCISCARTVHTDTKICPVCRQTIAQVLQVYES